MGKVLSSNSPEVKNCTETNYTHANCFAPQHLRHSSLVYIQFLQTSPLYISPVTKVTQDLLLTFLLWFSLKINDMALW